MTTDDYLLLDNTINAYQENFSLLNQTMCNIYDHISDNNNDTIHTTVLLLNTGSSDDSDIQATADAFAYASNEEQFSLSPVYLI